MTWFKVDDTLATHPKARRAGLQAMGLWTVAGAYAAQHLTEGFVPDWYVAAWPSGRKLAARLVAADLWVPDQQGGEVGWSFHQWDERQPTKAEVEADRKSNRERQRRFRRRNASGNAVTASVSDDVTNSVSNDPPSRPDLSHGSVVSRRPVSAGEDDDDLDAQLDKIVAAIGGTHRHAAKVRADILTRANGQVRDELAYVLRAIGAEPERYRPKPRGPRKHEQCPDHPGEWATTCRPCAADAKAAS